MQSNKDGKLESDEGRRIQPLDSREPKRHPEQARTVPAACRAPPPGQDINPSFSQDSDGRGCAGHKYPCHRELGRREPQPPSQHPPTCGRSCFIGSRRDQAWENLIPVTWTGLSRDIASPERGRLASQQALTGTDSETRRQWDGAWESVPGKTSWGSKALGPARRRPSTPRLQTDGDSVPLATLIPRRNGFYLF